MEPFNKIEPLLSAILSKMSKITKCQKKFLLHTLPLFLGIKGKINFLQLSRYGGCSESTYRTQFEKTAPFMEINSNLITTVGSGHYIAAFDPSHIEKSGKQTYGQGYFWSGCDTKMKRGLEIGGLSIIDVDNHAPFHLDAFQTLNKKGLEEIDSNLLKFYANQLIERKDSIEKFTSYLVVDGYFSKSTFVTPILEKTNLHVISRLRDDAALYFLYQGEQTGNKGRPKQYDGKVDKNKPNMKHFTVVYQDEEKIVYSATVYSKSLGRNIKLALTHYLDDKGKVKLIKLYFSTDTELSAWYIMEYYRLRFQIEFLFRDSNQYTGLEDCQARSQNKLNYHFNMSLSAVSFARAAYWLNVPIEQRKSFSMCDVKTLHHNHLLIQRFISMFQIPLNSQENVQKIKELCSYGTIAA